MVEGSVTVIDSSTVRRISLGPSSRCPVGVESPPVDENSPANEESLAVLPRWIGLKLDSQTHQQHKDTIVTHEQTSEGNSVTNRLQEAGFTRLELRTIGDHCLTTLLCSVELATQHQQSMSMEQSLISDESCQ